jgi:peptide/nickel transport system ATP-binding protein
MYAGQIVEQCPVDDALESPRHPYTSGLLGAIPRAGLAIEDLRAIPGRVPAPSDFPHGCRFAPRCEFRQPGCDEPQELLPVSTGRWVRCWRHDQLQLTGAVPA